MMVCWGQRGSGPFYSPKGPHSAGFSLQMASAEPKFMLAHRMSKTRQAGPLFLGPTLCKPRGTTRGHPKWFLWNPQLQLCAGPLREEGLEEAHSRDASGWVCAHRLQEEPSTCPRNAGGHTRPPLPHPCSPGVGQAQGYKGAPAGREGIWLQRLSRPET